MARLNEPPVSTDSLETLRRKLLRQNRDLAKLNNVRALRIRELENECACMLSENIQLRGRVLELEKQVEDSESRRIADHALAIKEQLESQLTEWGALIAGLGSEPPPKRRSPCIKRTAQKRMSFNVNRNSPSQRRLRDVAKDIEELGSISEHRASSRRSMNPDQILALRSGFDSTDAPELEPPRSPSIPDEPVKVDSPYTSPAKQHEPTILNQAAAPEALSSPRADRLPAPSPSPKKKAPDSTEQVAEAPAPPTPKAIVTMPQQSSESAASTVSPTKAGTKRKFNTRGETPDVNPLLKTMTNENQAPRNMVGKSSIRDKEGKTLKELTNMRKEESRPAVKATRKPLSAKSTNDDVASPKKNRASVTDEVAYAKAGISKPKVSQPIPDRSKTKSKPSAPKIVEVMPEPERAASVAPETCDLTAPVTEPDLLKPNSPQPAPSAEEARGDTPPPADISSKGETSRASRRSRGVVSYAEPNLRDKMRRPTKDMVDAVTGSRRSSQFEGMSHNSAQSKRESSANETSSSKKDAPEPGSIPASPLAKKSLNEKLSDSAVAGRRKRPSSTLTEEDMKQEEDTPKDESIESIGSSEVDVYEFTTSSPQSGRGGKRRSTTRQNKASSRRFSAAVEGDDSVGPKDRANSRRRSMMV